MKLIERNFFQKILLKLFPNSNNLFLVDDFKKIDLLFNEKKNMSKSNLGGMEKTGSGIGLQKPGNKPPVGGSAKPGKINLIRRFYEFVNDI